MADLDGNSLTLRGEVLRPDGSENIADDVTCAIEDGADAGIAMAERMLAKAGPDFFDWH